MSIAGLQQVCSASVPPSVMCQVCSQVSLHHGAVCRVRRFPYGGHIKHGSLQPWKSSGYRSELCWVIFLASHVWFPRMVDDLNISMHTFPAHQKSMTWTRYNPWWWFHLLWVLPFQYDIVIVLSRRITVYSIPYPMRIPIIKMLVSPCFVSSPWLSHIYPPMNYMN
jgi:hypothetical protein